MKNKKTMEVTGKIKHINDTVVVSEKFKKRELILVTDEKYPQTLSIQFIQDKTDLLNNLTPETSVKVAINLRGREWENKEGKVMYFNTIEGWKIDKVEEEKVVETIDDDLPF